MQLKTKLPTIKRKAEKYNLITEDIVLPEGSIKYELNLIEFPIFSKNRKIEENTQMTYIFSEAEDEFLSITPGNATENISNKILQEFDEKVFYALMRIYEETGDRKIISDYSKLIKIANIKYDTRSLFRVKDSLERMKNCTIKFNNSFYNAKAKLEGFDYIKQTKTLNLLSSLETISFEKIKTETEKEKYKQYFNRHKNIKEVFVAVLNEDIVENIRSKSHKYFKTQDLLEIENAVSRKIYIMLIKWKYWEKKNKIRRTVRFLASRIPLSWNKSNIPSTIKNIDRACLKLIELGKIEGYVINKENGLANSSIDFIFHKKKEQGILEDLNEKIGIEETGHEKIEIINSKKEVIEIEEVVEEYSKEVLELFEELPFEEQLDSRKSDLKRLLGEHSFDMIKADIEYCNRQDTKNYWGYLLKSINSGHYSAAEIEKAKKLKELKLKKEEIKRQKEQFEVIEKQQRKEEAGLMYEILEENDRLQYEEDFERQRKILERTGVDLKMFILMRLEERIREEG